mgnify:FL=1
MSITAMKQALEALSDFDYDKRMSAITSLRQFIAEAEKQDGNCQQCGGKGCVACDAREQEPVIDKSAAIRIATALGWEPKRDDTPAKAVEWVGLTRDEILEARWHNKSSYKFARVLEAKLKEKNT